MKKLLLLLFIFIISCAKQDPQEQLKNLNGYWEIDKVELSKDSVRQFNFNENIDYFEIKDSTGFRKKVRPQIDGSYKVFGNQENIKTRIKDDSLYLYYSTPYNTWKETVLEVKKNKMSIKNQRGIIYYYKRYKPLFEDEKEQ